MKTSEWDNDLKEKSKVQMLWKNLSCIWLVLVSLLSVPDFRVLNVLWCSCRNEFSSGITILGFSILSYVCASMKC